MLKIDILREVFKKQKVVRNTDLKELDIDRKFLQIAIEEGICERVCRGVYISSEYWMDSHCINQLKFKNSVYALQSALIIHDYTDLLHVKEAFLVDKKVDNDNFHFIKDNIEVGVIERETQFGNLVRVTDLERTIIDLIRYRKYVKADVYAQTFKRYMTSPEKNMNKIIKYAMELGCFEEVNQVLEVFYGW